MRRDVCPGSSEGAKWSVVGPQAERAAWPEPGPHAVGTPMSGGRMMRCGTPSRAGGSGGPNVPSAHRSRVVGAAATLGVPDMLLSETNRGRRAANAGRCLLLCHTRGTSKDSLARQGGVSHSRERVRGRPSFSVRVRVQIVRWDVGRAQTEALETPGLSAGADILIALAMTAGTK